MDDEEKAARRVRFYGVREMAAGYFVERFIEIVEQFDPIAGPATITDVIELSQLRAYLENRMFLRDRRHERRYGRLRRRLRVPLGTA